MAGNIVALTPEDITQIKIGLQLQLEKGLTGFKQFLTTIPLVKILPYIKFSDLEKEGYTTVNIKKIHDTYRLLRDEGKILDYGKVSSVSTPVVIAKIIAPTNPKPWGGRVFDVLDMVEMLISAGVIQSNRLYRSAAIAVEAVKQADQQNTADKAKNFLDTIVPMDKAKQTITITTVAIAGIVGVYLYSMVTANRAMSRWRNR